MAFNLLPAHAAHRSHVARCTSRLAMPAVTFFVFLMNTRMTTPANEIGIGHSRAVVAPRRVARALPVQAANLGPAANRWAPSSWLKFIFSHPIGQWRCVFTCSFFFFLFMLSLSFSIFTWNWFCLFIVKNWLLLFMFVLPLWLTFEQFEATLSFAWNWFYFTFCIILPFFFLLSSLILWLI